MPIGCFIARTARTLDFVSQIPVLVKVSMLKTVTPEDEELEGIDFAWFEIEYLFVRWMIERDRRKNAHKGQA